MNSEVQQTALVTTDRDYQAAIRNALRLWASAVTASSSEQRDELLRNKQRVVAAFFDFVEGKSPAEISAQDVETWRDDMTERGLKPATVYARVCFLSSFFGWAMRDPQLRVFITSNPARLALPKPPKAYQTEKVKAWTDAELQAIVEVVRAKAAGNDIVGKRDYAILLFFLVTGMRRQEIISLRGGNIKLGDDSIIMTGKVKGGDYVGREVREPLLRAALVEYLSACGRLDVLKRDAPLWTRHDNAGSPGAPLNSHSFAKNLKRYARTAGIGHVHLHQTRHSFARIVAEETGSITDVQDALGHRNAATTRVYVQRIAIKRDKHSAAVTARFSRQRS
ncbi:MAG: tyrosine-type recombinase/integrase [Pyrinomonadaceae bacterium MAG19_C2-C3]|nr:tyrosine-type recombinase/integrase [Pyrinomonadaceae bacterium MAG19_C2-C3]